MRASALRKLVPVNHGEVIERYREERARLGSVEDALSVESEVTSIVEAGLAERLA